MARKKSWNEFSGRKKALMVVVSLVQISLTVAGYRDLAKRSADEVEGPKIAWGVAMLANWVGPIAYFAKGRKGLGLNT
ncbi:PLDc N-terminal domain-containing protein [Oerskovia sp. Sa1BUA8]|uniref:PLDc N-terminal domain-containing protein n=1 Tax=Oerskovia douganii TaxID=2762210 RepID=A0A9D5UHI2_9CELL|nr:PLDc N-terminal domain-containing protein [Oerskovia douganii]MBE7700677.1 PLDc N-terminal domain-containing protein [Oerskovia douganii]